MHGGDVYRHNIILDFSVNINPLGIPESVREALVSAIERCPCYPDIRAEALRQAISEMLKVDAGNILCGNGASELFVAICHAIRPQKTLIPVPSFSGYERSVRAAGGELLFYRMQPEMGFVLSEDFLEQLCEDTDLIFLANPNNPVGNCISQKLLMQILQRCREKQIYVVLDECFIEFTKEWERITCLNRIREYPNVIVVRAFTKIFAIPGVRLGYLLCEDDTLRRKIEQQLPEWNLSVFAQTAGIAAAGELFYREKTQTLVMEERRYLADGLKQLGMQVYPGAANYLMFYGRPFLKEELLKRGILIRDCSDFRGLSKGYYRVAVKLHDENTRLLAEIRSITEKV